MIVVEFSGLANLPKLVVVRVAQAALQCMHSGHRSGCSSTNEYMCTNCPKHVGSRRTPNMSNDALGPRRSCCPRIMQAEREYDRAARRPCQGSIASEVGADDIELAWQAGAFVNSLQ